MYTKPQQGLKDNPTEQWHVSEIFLSTLVLFLTLTTRSCDFNCSSCCPSNFSLCPRFVMANPSPSNTIQLHWQLGEGGDSHVPPESCDTRVFSPDEYSRVREVHNNIHPLPDHTKLPGADTLVSYLHKQIWLLEWKVSCCWKLTLHVLLLSSTPLSAGWCSVK